MGKDQTHLYGRPLKFYQDLQKLNLAAAWSRVKVPALDSCTANTIGSWAAKIPS